MPDDAILRAITGLTLFATLLTSGLFRRRARRTESISRLREPPGLIMMRLVVALPLFGGTLLAIAHPPAIAWGAVALPGAARAIGAGLAVLTIPANVWVLRTLGSNISETVLTKDDHELVTSGPYRFVRHPLYTTGIALFGSVAVALGNAFLLLWTCLVAGLIRWTVVPREEAQLVDRFGTSYMEYRVRTGRLLPRFRAHHRMGRST